MNINLIQKALFVSVLIFSSMVQADYLCTNCKVEYVDSELINGDLKFKTRADVGTGNCVGSVITSVSNVTERQRDQILGILMAASMSGAKVDVQGLGAECGTFNHIRLKAPTS